MQRDDAAAYEALNATSTVPRTWQLDERERRDSEDRASEIAMLMKNRFLAHAVYDEWFLSRTDCNTFISRAPGMEYFRMTMFSRMIPNLREIGLLTERVRPRDAQVGLSRYSRAGRRTPSLHAHALETPRPRRARGVMIGV